MQGGTSLQIIPYYSHPHVHVVINDDTWYDETVATPRDPDDLPYSTCVAFGADQGIDNTWVKLSSLATKIKLFGKGNFKKYGQPSLQADALFNGYTNVWACRALPENATYANLIVLAHFRVGKILDELNQETGKVRLEVKFSTTSATQKNTTNGSRTDDDIQVYGQSLTKLTGDPISGYMTVPLFYIRSIGRGKYGNRYSLSLSRDVTAEREYGIKMYNYGLLVNDIRTVLEKEFAGSMYQTSRYEMSTLIDDVLDQFETGSCPVKIYTYQDNIDYLFEYYTQKVIIPNSEYIQASGTEADVAELRVAMSLTEDTFDSVFGYMLDTRTDDRIPYYRNYTVKASGPWVAPNLTVPDDGTSNKPLNVSDWNTAFVGASVVLVADPLNGGRRWQYNIISIDADTGNIVYDEGFEVYIDDNQYDGVNLSVDVGNLLSGGHDGDFQEISVSGQMRPPTEAELKILMSKEFVKIFHGEESKDRKILSPARMNLDFIFDANYNLTSDIDLNLDVNLSLLYNNSTVLTDQDAQQLSILGTENLLIDFDDLNVKKALYELNQFRCRNGMTIDYAEGAGTLLHLDCNYVGVRTVKVGYELLDLIEVMDQFDGRNTSVDLGYYEIFDPVSGKRIKVTATYYLAKNLINHLMVQGLNKPFTYSYATLRALSRNDISGITNGNMIKDSFRPDIDLIDWDVKEKLFKSRINYWLTSEEGRVVQRACQNTRQRDASALLEENNVRVLNTLKKGLEKACRSYLYEWNEPETRRGYTDAQMDVYRPWIGTMVQDLQIEFTANEWEQERMIMRCVVYVKFRDIVKRITLEINIQRPEY